MLDVIGAGATASSIIDWHSAWLESKEAAQIQDDIEGIYTEGRKKPPVRAIQASDFATLWPTQLYYVTKRAFQSYWRNPTYLMAKLFLNIAGGLFTGFTFFKADNSLQGTQNKLFVRFFLVEPISFHADVWLSTGCLRWDHHGCTPVKSAPGAVHRLQKRLRDAREAQSHVQLDCLSLVSDLG